MKWLSRSSTDLFFAGGDAPASRSCYCPATRTGSRVASATAEGRWALDAARSRGHPTLSNQEETSCLNRVFALIGA